MHQHHPILARFCVCRIVGVSINVLCFMFWVLCCHLDGSVELRTELGASTRYVGASALRARWR